MNRHEFLIEQIRQLLVDELETQLPPSAIHARTPLFNGGLGLNSFAVVDLISQLERKFQFQFREADFREEHFRDLQSLAELIESYHPAGLAELKETRA